MNIQMVSTIIDEKIEQNENHIVFTYYELKVKYNLSDEEISKFLELSKNRLINSNYNVYFTGDKYIYDEQETIVKDNELMIAIKQNK